jgi:hypothetical protein
MKKYSLIIVSMVILLIGAQVAFAQSAALPEPVLFGSVGEAVYSPPRSVLLYPEQNDMLSFLWNFGGHAGYIPIMTLAQAASTDAVVPASIRNNRYFVESLRLTNLANLAYEGGDYDASTLYSEEAVRYAQLSDEFVELQLKIREADDAIAAARRRMDYAVSVNAATRYPSEYSRAQSAYEEARGFRSAERWDDAINAANRVLAALAAVVAVGEQPIVVTPTPPLPGSTTPALPAQYTVRTWAEARDCLWNIAGRPWVYNDPNQWRLLYNTNKAKFPQPDNPDLILPGMILDIPSLKGEVRQGMWSPSLTYSPLQ